MATELDAFDLAILKLLQRDNRTPQRLIAEAVNLSPAAVQRRIRRLEESGVIRANVAVIDPAQVGRQLTVLVEVRFVSDNSALTLPLRRRIEAEPAVQQCYSVTGESDYVLIVTVASIEEYQALTQRLFDGDTNVRRFRTSVALERLKVGLQVPL